jgi:large-conductance mechanosensitive channel
MKSTRSSKKFIEILYEEHFLLIGFSFLIGHSCSTLLNSIINKLLMPFFSLLTDEKSWENATTTIGGVELEWGEPLSDLIHFAAAVVLSVYAYKYLKREPPEGHR